MEVEKLRLHPFYTDRRNDIIRPDETVVATRYFWDKWLRRLGPSLTALVIRLRIHCQEQRMRKELTNGADWASFRPSQEDLGGELGVSRKTIMRLLGEPEAAHFIRRENRYEADKKTGAPHRIPDEYFVRLDDPLTPEDDASLLIEAAESIAAHLLTQPYKSQTGTHRNVDNSTYESQNVPYTATRGKTSNDNELSDSLSVPDWDSNVKEITLTNNVNGRTPSEDQIRVQDFAQQLVDELSDSSSRAFFLRVAWRCPEAMVRAALSETRDAHLSGRIKKSQGACFTDLVKRKARTAGIEL